MLALQKDHTPADVALEEGNTDVVALLNRHALANLAGAGAGTGVGAGADAGTAAKAMRDGDEGVDLATRIADVRRS